MSSESREHGKTFNFLKQAHTEPAHWWFQQDPEGLVLFVVFYSKACRWNRCTGCNLPALSTLEDVGYLDLMAQIDTLFKIGGSRLNVASVMTSEIVAVLLAGVVLAGGLTFLTSQFGSAAIRAFIRM